MDIGPGYTRVKKVDIGPIHTSQRNVKRRHRSGLQ